MCGSVGVRVRGLIMVDACRWRKGETTGEVATRKVEKKEGTEGGQRETDIRERGEEDTQDDQRATNERGGVGMILSHCSRVDPG